MATIQEAGYRKDKYIEKIMRTLDDRGVPRAEADVLLDQIGFTKLRFIAHKVSPGDSPTRWIKYADERTTLVLQQEFNEGRTPPEKRRKALTLLLTNQVRDSLIATLTGQYAMPFREGNSRANGRNGSEGHDRAIKTLLRHARLGREQSL